MTTPLLQASRAVPPDDLKVCLRELVAEALEHRNCAEVLADLEALRVRARFMDCPGLSDQILDVMDAVVGSVGPHASL